MGRSGSVPGEFRVERGTILDTCTWPHHFCALPERVSLNGGCSYVIDRLIRDANGTRWVVDYKTGRQEEADIEGFLDREQKRYAAQLDAYAAALGGASRGLYFPLHAGWRKW